MGRVHRPDRGGGRGGDPAAGVRLHRAGRVRRGQGGQEGRRAVRDRPPALRGRAGPRRGGARGGPHPRRRWPARRSSGRSGWSPCRRSRGRSSTPAPAPRPRAEASIARRRGGGGDGAAQPGVDPGALAHRRPGEPGRGHGGEPGAGRAADATLLTTVVSLDPIYVYFEGDEQTYLKYGALARARRPAQLARHPEPGLAWASPTSRAFPHKGYVDFVDNQLNPETGTIRARGGLLQQGPGLHPGPVRAAQAGGQRRATARCSSRTAPSAPTRTRSSCWCSSPTARVEYRPVQIGRLVDGLRVVTAGLKAGERIVVNGLQRVRPGMKVSATAGADGPHRRRRDDP